MPLPTITGLDHVVLRTTRIEETLRFYRDLLGLPLERTVEPIGLYQLRAGSSLVDVIDSTVWTAAEAGPGQGLYDHFCLGVAGCSPDELVATLDAAGIPHGDPAERYGATGSGTSVYAQDPDGRTVELKLVGP